MPIDARTAFCAVLVGGLVATGSAHAAGPSRGEWLMRGIATFYSHYFDGRRTASGETYEPGRMTAANPNLPLGTRVRVTRDDGRSVVVTINDREPRNGNRVIDLSRAAARVLGVGGIATVTLSRVGPQEQAGGPVEVAEAPDGPIALARITHTPINLAPPLRPASSRR